MPDRRSAARRGRASSTAIDSMSDTSPRYEGSTSSTARASGARSNASRICETGTASASPLASSTSGTTHTGSAPDSTRPAITDLCEVRATITRWPSCAATRQSAWFGCVEPCTEKRVQSAPNARAASRSAWPSRSAEARRSSAPLEYGRSSASSGSSPTSACERLWPGRRPGGVAAREEGVDGVGEGSRHVVAHEAGA